MSVSQQDHDPWSPVHTHEMMEHFEWTNARTMLYFFLAQVSDKYFLFMAVSSLIIKMLVLKEKQVQNQLVCYTDKT